MNQTSLIIANVANEDVLSNEEIFYLVSVLVFFALYVISIWVYVKKCKKYSYSPFKQRNLTISLFCLFVPMLVFLGTALYPESEFERDSEFTALLIISLSWFVVGSIIHVVHCYMKSVRKIGFCLLNLMHNYMLMCLMTVLFPLAVIILWLTNRRN